MKRILVLIAVGGLMITTSAWAGSLTVTHDFVGGQKALASEVNQNFEDVETEVTNNAADITTNADGIQSNADSITDFKSQLGDKLDTPTCTDGQVLKYSSGIWVCAEDIDTTNTNAATLDGMDSSDFATTEELSTLNAAVQDAFSLTRIGYVSIRQIESNPTPPQSVFLPHGSIVNSFTLYFNDTVTNSGAIGSLNRKNLSTDTDETIASVYFGDLFNAGLGSAITYTITSPIIDNSSYAYFIGWGGSSQSIGVVIEYEYTLN